MSNRYFQLMRLDKPIGVLLLLWPTLWALWLAYEGCPPMHVLIVFVLGTIFMRSAGCIINDIADRHIDGKVKRTINRPLVTGAVSLTQAIFLFIILLSLSASLLFFLDVSLFFWALIGALFAIVYPFCKRFLATPQLILGFAFSWGIPLAFLNAKQLIHTDVLLLMLINGLWIICYDTYYAMIDKDDDLLIGVKSTAIFFGKWDRVIIIFLQTIIAALWLSIAYSYSLTHIFYLFYVCAQLLFVYQAWLAKQKTRSHYFKAFLNNHWYGIIMFLGIVAGQ
tara:strand:+ start:762 stop:1601 length:840 start_codon:yes stop_codon:yes gene_type:complete